MCPHLTNAQQGREAFGPRSYSCALALNLQGSEARRAYLADLMDGVLWRTHQPSATTEATTVRTNPW